MNKKLLFNILILSGISFSAIAMDLQIAKLKVTTLKPVTVVEFSGSVDAGREKYRDLSNSGAFIAPRSKERTKSMQERNEKEALEKKTLPRLDLFIPPYKSNLQSLNHTNHMAMSEKITKEEAFRKVVPSKNITIRRRAPSCTVAQRLIQEADSKTEKEYEFIPISREYTPINIKFQFDKAVEEVDVALVERILHDHQKMLQSYYPADLLIQHRKGHISLNSFEIDENKFGSTVSREKHKKILQALDSSDILTRHQFNQAVNSKNTIKVIDMCDSNQSLREDYPVASFLDGVYNHFRTEEKDFFIAADRMHSDINMDAFKQVALEVAQRGGNIAFQKAFRRNNIA